MAVKCGLVSDEGKGGVFITADGVKKAKELLLKRKWKFKLQPTGEGCGPKYAFEITKEKPTPAKAVAPSSSTIRNTTPDKASPDKLAQTAVDSKLLAKRIQNIETGMTAAKTQIVTKTKSPSPAPCKTPEGEVVLLIDTREMKTKKDRSYLYKNLCDNKIKCEKRALPLGDALWVYRCRPPAKTAAGESSDDSDSESTDYILSSIVERKKADDLASSIVDGRYVEQKRRLLECGIHNVIYVIEGEPSSNCRVGENSLQSAVTHTKVISGFIVFRVTTIEETIKWLTVWTEKMQHVAKKINNIPDECMTYQDFVEGSSKNSRTTAGKVFQNVFCVVRTHLISPACVDKRMQRRICSHPGQGLPNSSQAL